MNFGSHTFCLCICLIDSQVPRRIKRADCVKGERKDNALRGTVFTREVESYRVTRSSHVAERADESVDRPTQTVDGSSRPEQNAATEELSVQKDQLIKGASATAHSLAKLNND